LLGSRATAPSEHDGEKAPDPSRESQVFDENGSLVASADLGAALVVQVLSLAAGGGTAVDVTDLVLPAGRSLERRPVLLRRERTGVALTTSTPRLDRGRNVRSGSIDLRIRNLEAQTDLEAALEERTEGILIVTPNHD
jgi:hypothetical protein